MVQRGVSDQLTLTVRGKRTVARSSDQHMRVISNFTLFDFNQTITCILLLSELEFGSVCSLAAVAVK